MKPKPIPHLIRVELFYKPGIERWIGRVEYTDHVTIEITRRSFTGASAFVNKHVRGAGLCPAS